MQPLKSFRSFLLTENNDSFLITAKNKEEIYKIIFFSVLINLSNINKSFKILHLVQDGISDYIATTCNLSFPTVIFPTILKTAKVIPIHKKNSKLEVLRTNFSVFQYTYFLFLYSVFLLSVDFLTFLREKNPLSQPVWFSKRFLNKPFQIC